MVNKLLVLLLFEFLFFYEGNIPKIIKSPGMFFFFGLTSWHSVLFSFFFLLKPFYDPKPLISRKVPLLYSKLKVMRQVTYFGFFLYLKNNLYEDPAPLSELLLFSFLHFFFSFFFGPLRPKPVC